VTAAARLGRAVRAAASDITPLRDSPPFRRLFAGQAISLAGTQVTQVAVPLQVYEITHSSLDVGLIGVAGLVPLIAFGLYGGAIADAVDRRTLVITTSSASMLVSAVLLVQAAIHLNQVGLLFGCAAVQAGFGAADSPARRAILPQLLPPARLPAANTLVYGSSQLAIIAGPLLAGSAIAVGGYQWAYGIDVISFGGTLYAAARLPRLKPGEGSRRAGFASVAEGLRYLAGHKVVLMTFLVDINAMLFSSPRALFPALAHDQFGGGARTAGLLYAAPAVGAVAATAAGGAVSRVRRQGLGVVLAIAVWGVAIAGFGMATSLWLGLVMLAAAGAADTVSAVYRSTILQVATPSGMQGRLQGVYFVVVTGGPRLGDIRAGAMAEATGARVSVVSGGLACIAGIALLALAVPAFIRYDARDAVARELPAA
jgi:Transmembrane secretion effector